VTPRHRAVPAMDLDEPGRMPRRRLKAPIGDGRPRSDLLGCPA
jgi:hypothetical protein